MKTLQNLELGASLRVVEKDGAPWFVARDILDALGIGQATNRAVDKLDDDEKGVTQTHSLGGIQRTYIVSESGLYALILRSDKPAARAFRRWVTSEVLPQIRKTGGFSGAASRLESLRARERAAREELSEVSREIHAAKLATARALALEMGISAELESEIMPAPKIQTLAAPRKKWRRAVWKCNYAAISAAMPGPMPSADFRAWIMEKYGIGPVAAQKRMGRMVSKGFVSRDENFTYTPKTHE